MPTERREHQKVLNLTLMSDFHPRRTFGGDLFLTRCGRSPQCDVLTHLRSIMEAMLL